MHPNNLHTPHINEGERDRCLNRFRCVTIPWGSRCIVAYWGCWLSLFILFWSVAHLRRGMYARIIIFGITLSKMGEGCGFVGFFFVYENQDPRQQWESCQDEQFEVCWCLCKTTLLILAIASSRMYTGHNKSELPWQIIRLTLEPHKFDQRCVDGPLCLWTVPCGFKHTSHLLWSLPLPLDSLSVSNVVSLASWMEG